MGCINCFARVFGRRTRRGINRFAGGGIENFD
jgi:hypothetical protein